MSSPRHGADNLDRVAVNDAWDSDYLSRENRGSDKDCRDKPSNPRDRPCVRSHRSPGHHVDGGSFAEILVVLSATRWLRL